MNIIIIHGDNTVASYERLQKLILAAQKRGWEIVKISASLMGLSETISSSSLFKKDRLIVCEGVANITASDIRYLKQNKNLDETLLIYQPSVINKTYLAKFYKAKVEEYTLPKLLWKFLDSFYPGDSKRTLSLLKEVTKNEPIELVFAMLVRHLRDLYWVKVDPKGLTYPEWRISKLHNQSSKFKKSELRQIIGEAADIDLRVKKSQANLGDALDFLIISKLE